MYILTFSVYNDWINFSHQSFFSFTAQVIKTHHDTNEAWKKKTLFACSTWFYAVVFGGLSLANTQHVQNRLKILQ